MNGVLLLELLSAIRLIVDRVENDDPDAAGPTKLERALDDLEVIVIGLGGVWEELKPRIVRMVAVTVALFHRLGKFKRKSSAGSKA